MMAISAPAATFVARSRAATASARVWFGLADGLETLVGRAAGCWATAGSASQNPAAAASGNRARTFTTDLLVRGNVRRQSDDVKHAPRTRGVKLRDLWKSGSRRSRGGAMGRTALMRGNCGTAPAYVGE